MGCSYQRSQFYSLFDLFTSKFVASSEWNIVSGLSENLNIYCHLENESEQFAAKYENSSGVGSIVKF